MLATLHYLVPVAADNVRWRWIYFFTRAVLLLILLLAIHVQRLGSKDILYRGPSYGDGVFWTMPGVVPCLPCTSWHTVSCVVLWWPSFLKNRPFRRFSLHHRICYKILDWSSIVLATGLPESYGFQEVDDPKMVAYAKERSQWYRHCRSAKSKRYLITNNYVVMYIPTCHCHCHASLLAYIEGSHSWFVDPSQMPLDSFQPQAVNSFRKRGSITQTQNQNTEERIER